MFNRFTTPVNRCRPGAWDEFKQWYSSPLGRALLEVETHQLDGVLADMFGYHLLQVGRPCAADWLRSSRVSHCTVMDAAAPVAAVAPQKAGGFCAEPHSLPVASASLDIVVLPHVLEFSGHPHSVLREVERTLISEGKLVLLGFNPWSLWMVHRAALSWRGRAPWCGKFRGINRIRDWLALLGFDIESVQSYFFRPPWQHDRLMTRLNFMERLGARVWPPLGGGYVLVAKKRVLTMTPIRPRWRPRRRLVAPGLVEPYQNNRLPQNVSERLERHG